MEFQGLQSSLDSLKKEQMGRLTILDFKTYYKFTVLEQWY